jgi:hypothetical protein
VDALPLTRLLLRACRSPQGLVAAWGAVVTAGLIWQAAHETMPGETLPAASEWPAGSQITRSADRGIVVVFVHPRCPCTAATLAELQACVAAERMPPDVAILLPEPERAPTGFCEEARDHLQATWPAAAIVVDRRGTEARQFGALTSGHVLVYDHEGSLRFSGGITATRGHRGESPGRIALVAALAGQPRPTIVPATAAFPVFGCTLLDRPTPEEL